MPHHALLKVLLCFNKPAQNARRSAWVSTEIVAGGLPGRKKAFYTLAVTDWAVAFPAMMAARNAADLWPNSVPSLPNPSARATLRDQYGRTVDEGIQMLGRAINMDPNYSDAMTYTSLLDPLKAFLAESAAASATEVIEPMNGLTNRWPPTRDFLPPAPPLPPPRLLLG